MSKEFKIEYHGCGGFFWDETRPLISKYKSVCQNPTTDTFWKEMQHVKNVPCTRLQLRKRNIAPKKYVKEYNNAVLTKNLLKSTMAEFLKLKQRVNNTQKNKV